ncbi:SDR family NAD(P)-dependent oxidoreductase [Patulibacter sp. NPDC049589]|uniref:SDR family NAD(P)-dependent oxidoreductase n=1 Tax=Patulibacter sp. NPDC049589 TaxID=3154731 RepID=UPI0034157C55
MLLVKGVVHLTHHRVGHGGARRGKFLVTSSVAGLLPGPYYATYAASTSFVQSFSEALRHELEVTGVAVTALQPGPVDTSSSTAPTWTAPRPPRARRATPRMSRRPATTLQNGDDHVVVGAGGTLLSLASKVLPDPLKAELHGSMGKPGDDA